MVSVDLLLAQVGDIPVAEIVGGTSLLGLAAAAVIRIVTQDRNQQGVVDNYKALADERKKELDEAKVEITEKEARIAVLEEKLRLEQERSDSYHRRLIDYRRRLGLHSNDALVAEDENEEVL